MYFHIDGQRISIGLHKFGSLVGADYRIRARTRSTISSSTSASESNCCVVQANTSTLIIFCDSNFLLPLRQHIFRIERRAIEAQRLQSIFTFLSFFYKEGFPKCAISKTPIFRYCTLCLFAVPLQPENNDI